MRRILLAVFLASTCYALAAEEIVKIGSEVFHIASSESTDEATIKEFVPAGETIDNWTAMVAVRHFEKLHGPRIYIQNVAEAYRRSMPRMGFATGRVGSAEAWDIDFIMYDRSKRTDGFVEWNYLRAERRKFGEGIFVNQYVRRWRYSRSIEEVFGSPELPSFREEILPVLKQAEFLIVTGEPAGAEELAGAEEPTEEGEPVEEGEESAAGDDAG
ncbi:MAG: hypothetical protein OXI90_08365 [Gammaproteobacteria bacterium]|nr:hypothetical protein [Gammaproteobacteria bacterium]